MISLSTLLERHFQEKISAIHTAESQARNAGIIAKVDNRFREIENYEFASLFLIHSQ